MAMYIGDLFMRMSVSTPAIFYSPTFQRGGLAATFLIEVFNLMPHRGLQPHGDVADLGVHGGAQERGRHFVHVGGRLQQHDLGQHLEARRVEPEGRDRLAITVGGSAANNTVYANVLAPMWRPY
ncbi:MAG: hypothetical protein ACKOCB_07580 [Planctomycetia bacterium]